MITIKKHNLTVFLCAALLAGCAGGPLTATGPAAVDGNAVGNAQDPAAPRPGESNNEALERFMNSQNEPIDPAAAAAIDPAIFTFQHDSTVAARIRQNLTKDQPQLAGVLERLDLQRQQTFIDSLFPNRGMRATNVADAAATTIAVAFYHYQDAKTTTADQGMVVRDQMKIALSRATRIDQGSDAEKQTLAETLLYGAMILAGSAPKRGEPEPPELREQLKRNAASLLRRLKIDPDRYQLTQRGLTPL